MRTFVHHLERILLALALVVAAGSTGWAQGKPKAEKKKAAKANKPWAESPPIAKMLKYKTNPDNPTGFLSMAETYDDKGNCTLRVNYDYYGSGKEDSRSVISYDDKGRPVKEVSGDTVHTWEYDKQGRVKRETWKRSSDKAGGSEENHYDEHGNVAETKYYDKAGKYDFSRITTRKYESGHVVEEKRVEKEALHKTSLVQYWVKWKRDAAGKPLERFSLDENGSVLDRKVFRHDERGNLLEVLLYDEGSKFPTEKEVSVVDEHGAVVKDESYSCKSAASCERWSLTTYEYDEYGHMVKSVLDQAHGEDWGERVVYEYREAKKEAPRKAR